MMMIYDFYDKPHKSKGMNGHDLLLVIKKGFVWNVSMELQWDQEVCNGQLKILIAKLDFHLYEKNSKHFILTKKYRNLMKQIMKTSFDFILFLYFLFKINLIFQNRKV